ncbi:MAG: OmpW family outer membrane protein [Methylocystis sp.]
MKTVIRGALAATLLSAACATGHAADLPSIKDAPPPPPVFVDTYQPFQVRLKVGGVIPTAGAGTVYDFGAVYPGLPNGGSVGLAAGLSNGFNTVIPGASTSTSWSVIPMLDVAYYLNKNWAVEAICCVSPAHIQGTGTIASEFAHTWVFPPTLLLQYHFTNFGRFQPYLGVGVNFTTYWGTRVNTQTWQLPVMPGSLLGVGGAGLTGLNAQFQSATVTPSWGVAGQAGFDYMFNEHWGVNLDIKYIMMEPTVHSNVVAWSPQAPGLGAIYVPVRVYLPINPLVVSTGLTYRFGGGSVAPVMAKY